MFRIIQEANITNKVNISDYIKNYPLEKICFFDIETTGFSAHNTSLYLIGVAYYEKESWYIQQWFADSKDDETDILNSFLSFVKDYSLLVSYNGIGFDISYIKNKCNLLGIEFTLNLALHLDIFKQIKSYKKILKLDKMKQKSIEEFLGIEREDKYSGKELISQYINYLNTKDPLLKENLLLHNNNDICGLISILPVLSYKFFFDGNFKVIGINIEKGKSYSNEDISDAIIEYSLNTPLPKKFSYGNGSFYITGHNNTAKLKVRIYNNELKFFYSNYKDYYYLPKEDMAIHKSVAFYVDKDYRTKAKAANCYSKKTGRFLPEFSDIISPYFKIEYNDKTMYFEMTDEFMQNKEQIKLYSLHIFKHFQSASQSDQYH